MKSKRSMKKQLTWMALMLSFVMAFTGCGAADSAASESMSMNGMYATGEAMKDMSIGWDGGYVQDSAMEEAVIDRAPDMEAGSTTQNGSANVQNMNEKLIKTVDMTVETKEYDALVASIQQEIKSLGGYIENFNAYNGSKYSGRTSERNADITVRIPQDKLDIFVSSVSELGNVVRRSESVQNVTLKYVDLDSHKKALQAEYDRLIQLLEKAESIEDIITIENRLSSVRYQIEGMEAQLRTIDNQVSYSTVYMNIDEVAVFTPVVEEKTAFERIAEGFKESLTDIGISVQEFVIAFIINIPYLIIWAVIILVVVFIIRKSSKKRKAKKVKLEETKETKNESETV
ncbi:MAG: DUF4349 domain-containing protein [Lachnospiraceae bacterium]|nr:DUF4349 domain-containing protein [Lachnospiraceae bacterium]